MEGPPITPIPDEEVVNPHDSECCVCMDHLSDTKLEPCNHTVCLECATYLSFEKIKQCPLCRARFTHIVPEYKCSKPSNPLDFVNILPKSDILAKIILKVANKVTNPVNLTAMIKKLGNEISGFMSLTEAESILQYLEDNAKNTSEIGNMIVRMCNTPWLVDVKLASSGVCYFGNFGDKPSLEHALSILRNNRGNSFNSVSYNCR